MTSHFRFGFVLGDGLPNFLEGSDWSDFIVALGGDDVVEAGDGNDTVFAGHGNDRVDAGDGDDRVFAGQGDDWIHAGGGNDRVDGGRGFDTVGFDGSIFDYDVSFKGNWHSTTAIVTRFGEDGTQVEVDYLKHVEALYFENEDYTLYIDGRNNQVLALDDVAATDEDTVLVLDQQDLLANDTDFDGDALTLTSVDTLSGSGAVITFVNGQITYNPLGIFDALAEGETATDTFSYTVDDGKGGAATATVTVTIAGRNDAPALCQTSVVTFAENGDGVVSTAEAHDVEGDAVSFAISGGDDAALFTIDAATGELRFVAAPDFEAPADADADNVYHVRVAADDGNGGVTEQDVAVYVEDVAEAQPGTVIAYDMVGSSSQNLISFTNGAPVFSSLGDAFGKYQVGVSASIPFQIVDDSAAVFLADSQGIIDSNANFDEFFGATDTVNGDNSGPLNATWLFDISGFHDLSVLVDAGAMGDFESSDSFTISYSIDAAPAQTLFSFVADEDGSQSYTLADGDVFNLNDPLVETATGTVLSNVLQTLSQSISGTGSELALTLTGSTDGGSEAFALQNLIVKGVEDGPGPVEPSYAVSAGTAEFFEGDSGSTTVTFEVTRSGDVSEAGSVAYSVIGDLDADDIASGDLAGVLDFAAGETSKTITLEIAGDTLDECDETLAVTLTDPVNGTISDQIATTIVRNDDNVTLISEIQGEGSASLLTGSYVLVSAVVTYTTGSGFYLQEEDADADGNELTSEGIFVFTGGAPAVETGDLVKVGGYVAEHFGLTELTSVDFLNVVAEGTTLPTAADIHLSTASTNFEQYEAMRISVTSGIEGEELTIIENFNFDRFGDITISAGTQTQATQLYDAQTEADQIAAHTEGNMNNRLVITDGVSAQNPDSFAYVANTTSGDDGDGVLSSGDDFTADGPTLRLGTELDAPVEGVLTYEFGEYKVLVDGTLSIDEDTNSGARQQTPDDVGGDLQVASFNVLNYFTTFSGGTGPDGNLSPRGANNQAEFDRQSAKIVDALTKTGAEVFALQEIENNGFGDASAIATLVDALNAEATDLGTGAVYDFVNPLGMDGFVGTDAIMTGIVYDTSKLTLLHADVLVFEESSAAATYALAEILNPYVSAGDQLGDFQRSRPTTVATFQDENGEIFTIASNHFKSKGDSNLQDLADGVQAALDNGSVPLDQVATVQAALDALRADPNFDQGDGQGFWNGVRAEDAQELVAWLEGDYASDLEDLGIFDADYLLMGDFNAYAEEDPVQAVRDEAGYTDLIAEFLGQDEAYSYVFDGQQGTLDQALASGDLVGQVTGLTEWHINADEPDLLGYDQSFNDPGFYNDDVFASSDHDPVIVGLDLGSHNDALLA